MQTERQAGGGSAAGNRPESPAPRFRSARRIDEIIVHCSATRPGQGCTARDVRRWHTAERGFRDIGYHFVVETDGSVSKGRPLDLAERTARGITSVRSGCAIWVVSAPTAPRPTPAPRPSAPPWRNCSERFRARFPGRASAPTATSPVRRAPVSTLRRNTLSSGAADGPAVSAAAVGRRGHGGVVVFLKCFRWSFDLFRKFVRSIEHKPFI